MTDHGGAASPRTEAGKRLLGRLYRTDPANGAAGLSGEYLHGRLRLTEDILAIEAEAAQEAPAPERRPTHHWNDPDGDGHDCADCASDSMWKCDATAHVPGHARYPDPACPVCVERHATAILDSLPAQEAPAPEGLRATDCPVCASGDVGHERAERLDLPPRIVVDARGFYWRDYGDHHSMCPVTEDNEPVKPAAVYLPDGIAAATPPTPAEPPHIDDIPGPHPESEEWHRGYCSGRAEARPPEGLVADVLARAMRFGVAWESVPHPDEWLAVAEKVAAEYARLSAGGATKPQGGER